MSTQDLPGLEPRAELTSAEKAEMVRDYERQTIGSTELHPHALVRGVMFTNGIKYLADVCGAHWLVDAVASHQNGIYRRYPAECGFQVWRLEYNPTDARPSTWVLEAWSDTPGALESVRMVRQVIGYSDFPAELDGYEFYCEGGVVLMKAER